MAIGEHEQLTSLDTSLPATCAEPSNASSCSNAKYCALVCKGRRRGHSRKHMHLARMVVQQYKAQSPCQKSRATRDESVNS